MAVRHFWCGEAGNCSLDCIELESHDAMVAASKRYLATENSGEAIDGSLYILAFGIVLGVLVKIAKGSKAS